MVLLNALFVVLLDQLSKNYIRNTLAEGDSIPVIKGVFHITYVKNPGGAFGLFPNHQLIFLIISLVVILVIIVYWWRVTVEGKLMKIAFGLELGGVVGNLIDRIFVSEVVDFLDFRLWPVFNIADMAIVGGLILVLFDLLRIYREESRI